MHLDNLHCILSHYADAFGIDPTTRRFGEGVRTGRSDPAWDSSAARRLLAFVRARFLRLRAGVAGHGWRV
jgi:hypothetical protein